MTTDTILTSEQRPRTTARTRTAADRLRLVLAVNAATSIVAGAAAATAAGPVSELLGVDSNTGELSTRMVGVGLVVFGVIVAAAARRANGSALRSAATEISLVDIAWVIATIVVLAAGVLSTTGTVIAIVMGVGVADFAALQLWLRRRLGRDAGTA